MAKCARCEVRKAKRHCPALGINLCPLCCGLMREKKIHCPSTCVFLTQHKPYQEKKIIQKKQTYSNEVFEDERLSWLTLHIQAPLAERAKKDPSFTDKDALLALEYAREKIERGRSRLLLPSEKSSLQNKTGETIFKSTEQCRYERTLVLPSAVADYKKEEKLKCLENIILEAKYFAAENWGGRNYLQHLSQRFSRLEEISAKKKITLLP